MFRSASVFMRVDERNYSEKRKHPRLDVKQTVHYRVGDGKEISKGSIKNIGAGGLCLHSSAPLKTGDKVSIEFELPGNIGKHLATARVVWSQSATDSEYETRHLAGISFENIQEHRRKEILGYVDKRIKTIRMGKEERGETEQSVEIPIILVVDDDPDLLVSMKDLLSVKYKVLTARDGYEAVKIANEKKPDLILLDLKLPIIDGFSVLMMLKSEDETRPIPVVILSAVKEKSQIIRAQQEGAMGYITKPFDPEKVFAKIEQLVPSRSDE